MYNVVTAMNIFDMISQKFNKKVLKANSSCTTNPLDCNVSDLNSAFMNKMSERALNLYERQCDIKNFTKLAMSDPENQSHNELVEKLLKEDILDPLSDEVIRELSSNEDLLRDLNL